MDVLGHRVGGRICPSNNRCRLSPRCRLTTVGVFYGTLHVTSIGNFHRRFPAKCIGAIGDVVRFCTGVYFPSCDGPYFDSTGLKSHPTRVHGCRS